MLIDCYYLLYKVTESELLWIIALSEDYGELKSRIKNFISKSETYFVVFKPTEEKEVDKKFKQFKIFQIDNSCVLLKQTYK
jgi:hypothetical protein